jgi:hypothetical protein
VRNLRIPLEKLVAVLGVAAILTIRPMASGASTASAGAAPVQMKPQANSIPSCSGDSPGSSGQPPPAGGSKQHSVTLSWNPSVPVSDSPGDAIKGYYVYRSQTSQKYADGNRITVLPLIGTGCLDTTVQPRATYYYVVKAITESGKQSLVSREIKAVIPFP